MNEQQREHLDALVGEYLDRLNDGEHLDPEDVLIEHPDLGPAILDEIRTFVDLGSGERAAHASLGALGDYTLRRQIGRGGMGVVYEAWENSMDRAVALKVLPAGIAADEKACTRFMREAQTAGKLSHANVVGVYSTGVKEGTPWYSMELIEGETLAQITARWKNADEQIETPFGRRGELAFYSNLASAFADVADGLQHAHSRGVVHRDIKPSNLILDGDGALRILDFGLARLEGQESLTLSGDLMGTVLYMSPEQAMAKRIPLDHRTDIYSLGATLYEMVTGQPPFRGKNQHETLSQIVVRDPRSPRQLSPGVPKDLETVVLKCLRKDADERYGTAEALAQDLRRFVRGDPIEARPQSPWERMATRLKRQRTALAVAAVFLALVVVAGWMAYRREQAEERVEAVTQEVRQARYAAAVREMRKRMYAQQYSLQVVEGEVPGLFFRPSGRSLARMTPEEVVGIRGDRGTHPVEEAALELSSIAEVFPKPDAHYHLARAYQLLGRGDEVKFRLERALEFDAGFVPAEVLLSELSGSPTFEAIRSAGQHADGWRRVWLEAHASERDADWAGAAEAYGELIALSESGAEPYVGAEIEAHVGRGNAYLELQSYFRATRDFEAACKLAPRFALGALLLGKAHYLKAEQEGRAEKYEAKEIFAELHAEAEPGEKSEVALWIAGVYYSLKDYNEGLYWVERLGADVRIRHRLGSYFLLRSGEARRAIEAGREAIRLDDEDPVAHLVLASALRADLERRRGPDRQRALTELLGVAERALELNPWNESARETLAATRAEVQSFMTILLRDKSMKYPQTWGLVWAALVAVGVVSDQALGASPLVRSTYIGGTGNERGPKLAIGPDGSIFVGGNTDWPQGLPEADSQLIRAGGGRETLVMKLSADGSELLWWAALGGSGDDRVRHLHVDDDGIVTIVGVASTGFPVTDNAHQSEFGGGGRDAFVARLDPRVDDPEEQLIFSTLFGGAGEDAGLRVHVNAEGIITFFGYTTSRHDFPVTDGAFQEQFGGGLLDTFVARMIPRPGGTDLVYSTYLGGSGDDPRDNEGNKLNNFGMTVDDEDTVVLAGHTTSRNFPTTPGAYSETLIGGDYDVFLVRLRCDASAPANEQLLYGTYLGGSDNEAPIGVVLDARGGMVVTGWAWSPDFPTTRGAAQRTSGGMHDVFLSRIDPAKRGADQLTYSTLFGGSQPDLPSGVALLGDGSVCFTGRTRSWDFPSCVGACVKRAFEGPQDSFVVVLDMEMDGPAGIEYSSLYGGSGDDGAASAPVVDADGVVIAAGPTWSFDFPTDSEAFQRELGGQSDIYVAAFDFERFLRGDCNSDGQVDIADASCTLNWLFSSADEPGCVAATNANGDEDVNLADAVYVLNHLFNGGPAPAQPYPECGPRSVEADFELGCEAVPGSCR